MTHVFGPLVFFGSGEISATAQPIYQSILRELQAPVRISVLETPAGFQLNSADVASAVAEYLQVHLQNLAPEVSVIPARKRGTLYSPDNAAILAPMLTSQMLFLGPGSPTYAVRQLRDSLAWQILQVRHRQGYPVVLASAATIAASAWALPVYEIYKVGEDVHWNPGLGLLTPFGLSVVFVPHWNNNEGGEKHDTSRCYMGAPRFGEMRTLLPDDAMIVGIDEHTALVLDPEPGQCRVMGVGGVTLIQGQRQERYETGDTLSCTALGHWRLPEQDALPQRVWQMIELAEQRLEAQNEPSEKVLALAEQRQQARQNKDWATSDQLRDQLAALGWQVHDTPHGPELERLNSSSQR